jgi:hypothetical protein
LHLAEDQEDFILLYGFSNVPLLSIGWQVHAFEEVLWTYDITAPKERAKRNILVVAPVERPKRTRANVDISSTPW